MPKVLSLKDRLSEILEVLKNMDPEIEAAAFVRSDGLILAAFLPENIDKNLVAAMSAAVLNIGKRAFSELKRGEINEIVIRGGRGIMAIKGVSDNSVLVAIAIPEANLGMLLYEMEKAANDANKLLS